MTTSRAGRLRGGISGRVEPFQARGPRPLFATVFLLQARWLCLWASRASGISQSLGAQLARNIEFEN